MKIVFTGGGTGGHFYPLMAVAEKVRALAVQNKLTEPKMYYFGEKNYNSSMLEERNIAYKHVPSGKNRLYFSFSNFSDYFKISFGVVVAFFKLLFIYPDVIFSKGGYDSVPTCIAAFLLRIPIVMHDSDAIPGRASLFISKFASRIALSYSDAAKYFKDQSIIAITGQPILERYTPDKSFVRNYKNSRKNILITGGSLGSQKINDAVLQVLPELCSKYNVIHQTGEENIEDIKSRSSVILVNYNKDAYAPYASLDFSRIYSQIDLVVSRAGSSMFEFAAWQIPSIIVPISKSVSRDQVINAESASKSGFIKMIEEENLSPYLLLNVINNILENPEVYNTMKNSSSNFYKGNGADIIASELLNIILSHAKS